jgi:hypothetical protein
MKISSFTLSIDFSWLWKVFLPSHVQWWFLKNVHSILYDGGVCVIIAVAVWKNMAVKVNNDHTSSRLRRARLNSNYIFMCFHHQKWFFMFLSFIFFDGNITTIFRSLSTFLYAARHFFSFLFTLLFYFCLTFCIAGNKVPFYNY